MSGDEFEGMLNWGMDQYMYVLCSIVLFYYRGIVSSHVGALLWMILYYHDDDVCRHLIGTCTGRMSANHPVYSQAS